MILAVRFVLLVIGAALTAASPFAAGAAAQDKLPVEVVPQIGHTDAIWSVAFSPDGRFALTGSEDNTLRLWDVATGKELRSFSGHTNFVSSVAFSPDGRFALSGSWDDTVRLWNVSTGKELRSFNGHTAFLEAVAFSPDGRLALSGGQDKTLKLWDVATGRELHSFSGHTSAVWSVVFSPDGRFALSGGGDATLRLWDVSTGEELRKFTGHTGNVWSVAFSPDGHTAISGGADKTMKLWDVATGQELRSFSGNTAVVRSLALSPNGRFALSGSDDGRLRLWDVAAGRQLRVLGRHRNLVRSLAFSPDGGFALSGSQDGTFKLWDIGSGEQLRSFSGHAGAVSSVAVSGDGRFVLSGSSDHMLRLWEVATGKELRRFTGHTANVLSVAFSPDGHLALSGSWDKTLKLWDVATGRELHSFTGHTGEVWSVTFSADGRLALSGGGRFVPRSRGRRFTRPSKEDNALKLWDLATGQVLRSFVGHVGAVKSVALSPDGRFALSGSDDRTVKLWDVATGRELHSFNGHTGFIRSVAFSPDGRFALSGAWDSTLRLWDLATGQELRSFAGHGSYIESVTFSPDGRFALSGSHDNTMRLWDVATGRELRRFTGHAGIVQSVAFSPDRRLVFSGSHDGTIRIWDLAKGQELARMMAASDGEWLTMTPKGFFSASPRGDELLSVVRGLDSYSVLQFYEHLARPDLVAELLKGDLEGRYRSAANVLNLETILDSGPAPKLERLNNREKKSEGRADLAVRLTDRGGGIGEKVIWRVNGVAQGATTAPGLGGSPSPGRYAVMEQTLRFDPTRKNAVEVVAYNAKGLLATVPLRFSIDPVFGITDKPAPRLFVLAVGVDNYLKPDWRLSNAVSDAKTISAALKAVGSAFFGENNVEITTVLDENATEKGIGAAFERIAAKVEPQDVFVLFLSGHGRAIAGSGPGTGWFFLPQNLDLGPQTIPDNAISSKRLENWLRRISASKSVIVLDACELGAFEAPRGDNLETETTIAQFTFATGRSTISAAAQGKAAYEGYRGHGILTYALLEFLNRQDGESDDTVDLLGVGSYVSRRVIEISKKEFGIVQTPKTDLKDNFTLGIRQPVLTPAVSECKVPDQSNGPSHIITRSVDVREKPSDDAAVTAALTRNTLVTLKACAGAWALIMRGGKDIGYVPLTAMDAVN